MSEPEVIPSGYAFYTHPETKRVRIDFQQTDYMVEFSHDQWEDFVATVIEVDRELNGKPTQ